MLTENDYGEILIFAFNSFAVLIYIINCLFILREFRAHIIMLGFLLFNQCWSVISCYYNDLGIYNFELLQYTVPSYATTWLVLFYLAFNFGFLYTGRYLKSRTILRVNFIIYGFVSLKNFFKLITYIFLLIITLYISHEISKNGVNFFSGISREQIYREADLIGRMLENYAFIIVFALGFFRMSKGINLFHDSILILVITYFVSNGHKFSGLLLILTCYFIPWWARLYHSNPNAKMINRKLSIYVIVGLFFVILSSLTQYNHSTGGSDAVNQILIDRIFATQGHLWWAVNNQTFLTDQSHWLTELKAILIPSSVPDESIGMKYLMVNILGWNKALSIFDIGYLYTMAYPAILVATLPVWMGLITQYLAGTFFLIILNYLYNAINYGYFLRSVVCLLVIIPFISTLFSGSFGTFLTIGIIFKLLFLITLSSKSIMTSYRISNDR